MLYIFQSKMYANQTSYKVFDSSGTKIIGELRRVKGSIPNIVFFSILLFLSLRMCELYRQCHFRSCLIFKTWFVYILIAFNRNLFKLWIVFWILFSLIFTHKFMSVIFQSFENWHWNSVHGLVNFESKFLRKFKKIIYCSTKKYRNLQKLIWFPVKIHVF